MRDKPLKLWASADKWAEVRSKAVASGSEAQMANVLEMALQDIAALHDAIAGEIDPWIEIRGLMEPIKFPKQ
jgi:hypothetical protein